MSPAEIAARLSPAQKRAIYPGPGNPEYARGAHRTMDVLDGLGLADSPSPLWGHGQRGGILTPLGLAVRAETERMEGKDHG
jgi:hypothetical protein